MKDKKRVLTVLFILIIVVACILLIVLVFGGIKSLQVNNYQSKLEQAACNMAEEEHYTETICEGFENLCHVHFDKLVSREYIDKDMKNPLTKVNAYADRNNYIDITWENDEMICTYKEG